MQNVINQNLSKIIQPQPEINSDTSQNSESTKLKNKTKIVNYPHVGVINLPKISSTPVSDTMEIKKNENPYTVYKLKEKKYPFLNFNNLTFATILICALGALFGLKNK